VEAFPFPHTVRVDMMLSRLGLRIETTVRADAGSRVPVSFGWHPYFRVPGAARADWVLTLPGGGEPAPLGERVFDDGFDGISEGQVLAIGDIRVRFGGGYPVAQVFAPAAADVVSLEPMTAPTNALMTGDGLRVLEPGEAFTARFAVEVG